MNASTFWMVISILGGLMVAIGSWQYNHHFTIETQKSIELENNEKRKNLSSMAANILEPEILSNIEAIETARKTQEPEDLKNNAWSIVSSSEILLNLEPKQLKRYLDIYQSTSKIRSLYLKFREYKEGVSSALGNSKELLASYKDQYFKEVENFKAIAGN